MKKLIFIPLSWLYGLVVAIRNRLFEMEILHSKEFSIPTISVGNIAVGGTGKTPHTEYLVRLLHQEFKVATLSRGYKRKTKGFHIARVDSTVNEVGDEPLQIKQKFPEITVAVDEKRVHGVEELLKSEKHHRPEIILLDDAFQHRYINPGVNILLTEYNRLVTQDHLLPYGRLREKASNRIRANMIIVTKCPGELKPIDERIITKELDIKPFQNLYFTTLEYGAPVPVFPGKVREAYSHIDSAVLLVTGIANPEPLKEYLRHRTVEIHEIAFSDHRNFTNKDMERVEERFIEIQSPQKIIITTEKDMIRIKGLNHVPDIVKESLHYIPLEIKFLNDGKKNFDRKILNYVRENKSNFDLYSRANRV